MNEQSKHKKKTGRPRKFEPGQLKVVGFSIEKVHIDAIDKRAKADKKSNSHVVRMIISRAISEGWMQ